MKYDRIVKGVFIERPNRFVAMVAVDGETVTAHVKNTGRCKELLIPGATVYLQDFSGAMGGRKLRYSLIAVEKSGAIINVDSQAPNKLVAEALRDRSLILPDMADLAEIKAEKTFQSSRFDFYLKDKSGREGFLEVKGVTLEEDGFVRFPDAPTERGIKHLKELISARKSGFYAGVIFVIQMEKVTRFEPNYATHKEFGHWLKKAADEGVKVYAVNTKVTKDTLIIGDFISVKLTND